MPFSLPIADPKGWRTYSQGKVRQLYTRGDDEWGLLVASDQVSAFDVVFAELQEGKGEILSQVSRYWFAQIPDEFPSHCQMPQGDALQAALEYEDHQRLGARAMLVERTRPLTIEAIVRQHLEGSAWSEYQRTQTVGGQAQDAGLRRYDCLPEAAFTPTTKSFQGGKDLPISDEEARALIGDENFEAVRSISLRLFAFARQHALARGLVLCDSKFEFGLNGSGRLLLIDELFTPDSSRYWRKEDYDAGRPEPLDKQYLRDWLRAMGFSGSGPIPALPPQLLGSLSSRYCELRERLIGD